MYKKYKEQLLYQSSPEGRNINDADKNDIKNDILKTDDDLVAKMKETEALLQDVIGNKIPKQDGIKNDKQDISPLTERISGRLQTRK